MPAEDERRVARLGEEGPVQQVLEAAPPEAAWLPRVRTDGRRPPRRTADLVLVAAVVGVLGALAAQVAVGWAARPAADDVLVADQVADGPAAAAAADDPLLDDPRTSLDGGSWPTATTTASRDLADASPTSTTGTVDPSDPAGADPTDDTATSTATGASTRSATGDPAGTTGRPHPGSAVGLLTFRGNPTRTFHGTGPIPASAALDWSYPARGAMCGSSTVGEETTEWCGTGWTGQPAVVERDGRTWLVFGAYDHAIHFVDAETGLDLLPPFPTGDIIKGSVTVDPDGFPIVYSGSRDGRYRAIAVDGAEPRELWALTAADATGPTRWNDDWDGSGLVLDDRLVIGGENSRLFVVQLNRGYDADGRVTVDPQVLWDTEGWDEALLADVGDGNVSIEGSVAVHDDVVYLANSGGLVQGWDLAPLRRGGDPRRVLRWWVGDDTDATIVVDDEGMLYVAAEHERRTARSEEVGQVVKLDPRRPDDPLVWSFRDPRAGGAADAGVWATPALHGDTLIVPTTGGTVHGLDVADGSVRWELELGDHLWSSPVVVHDVLVQGDCAGGLHAFDLPPAGAARAGSSAAPTPRWTVQLEGCIESTPAVWAGRAYVGTRAGQVHAIAPAAAGGGASATR